MLTKTIQTTTTRGVIWTMQQQQKRQSVRFTVGTLGSRAAFLVLLGTTSLAQAFQNRPYTTTPSTNLFGVQRTTTRRFLSEREQQQSTSVMKQDKMTKIDPLLPTMIVFDLDDCLWSPEMYTLWSKPSIPETGDLGDGSSTGVVGMKVPPAGPTVRLFPGARKVLRELITDPKYEGIILAAASSSEEPSFSYACLEGIEITPQVTLRQIISYDQIGRTGALSPDKRTHFRLLHQESQVPYEEMLFFDDCNWGDHCRTVSREFGVVSQRTPAGMQYSEFVEALDKYKQAALKRQASTTEEE